MNSTMLARLSLMAFAGGASWNWIVSFLSDFFCHACMAGGCMARRGGAAWRGIVCKGCMARWRGGVAAQRHSGGAR